MSDTNSNDAAETPAMHKRYRRPKTRPGELIAQWGTVEGMPPNLCYFRGTGIPNPDMHLLHDVLFGPRIRLNLDAPLGSTRCNWTLHEPSFLEELEARGNDVTTLRVYVRKKATTEGTPKL
jgi:hypothetical protein